MNYTSSSILSLISHIHSQSQNFLQAEMKELGLKEMASSHGNILFHLSENEELTLGDISARINRDKSTTTSLVKKLEKEHFVQIRKDEKDSRKKLISLTEEGKKYRKATTALSRKLLEKTWQHFDENEKNQLVELLNKLSGNLN